MNNTLGLSLALDSQATSQYEGLPFTGFIALGGQVYGLAPDGLCLLGGDDDDGSPISWLSRGPKSNLIPDSVSRLRSVSVGGGLGEAITVAIIVDEEEPREYDLDPGFRETGQHVCPVGSKGVGMYWQWEIRGEGRTFDINSISIQAQNLGRRPRG